MPPDRMLSEADHGWYDRRPAVDRLCSEGRESRLVVATTERMPLYALEVVSESCGSDERGAEASDEDSALKDVIRFCLY